MFQKSKAACAEERTAPSSSPDSVLTNGNEFLTRFLSRGHFRPFPKAEKFWLHV